MKEFLNQTFEVGGSKINLSNLILFVIAILVSWLFTKLIVTLLNRALKSRNIENSKVYSLTRIVKFVLYTFFFLFSLQLLHLNLSGILLGASALLIGVGIGLQQIFYDIFSGILMQVERKVKVDDFVEIDGMVGRVDKIDMRTSIVRTINNISVIVPNSKLISDNVINWSSNRGLARFKVQVGVAYGSDTAKVKQVLINCAMEHSKILDKPAPAVLFIAFGASSLDFSLLFWSRHFREIEAIKSDLHFSIDNAFRANQIEIAFPQIDVHIKR